jgi:hypothetical protein
MSWEEAIRCFAAMREHYMLAFRFSHERLRDKNPERFRLP